MRKRITSLFLVLALCLTLLPTAALAEEASSAAQETQDSTEVGDGCTIEEDTAVQGKGENDGVQLAGDLVRVGVRDVLRIRKRVDQRLYGLHRLVIYP